MRLRDVPDCTARALAVAASRREDKRLELMRLAHENFSRLMAALQKNGAAKDTIVVFLTDNGSAVAASNAGMGRIGPVAGSV